MSTGRSVFVSIETTAYSGATLLALLLGAHPGIATVGEMNGLVATADPDLYLCSCGQRIKACGFWQSVQSAMRDRGFEFDVAHFGTGFTLGGPRLVEYLRYGSSRNRALDSARDAILWALPAERRAWEALVARNEAFVESVLEVTGKEVFVDTSKDPPRLRALRRFSTLDLHAIHLTRDVRGVVASQLRHGTSQDVREATKKWISAQHKIRVGLHSLPPGKQVLLRYEDLCRDVAGTLEQLYRLCGVDPGFKVADGRVVPHHIIGNRMRLMPISEIKPDERWRSELREDQLREIAQMAGALGHQYGYY